MSDPIESRVHVRAGEPVDIPDIIRLIRSLAEFEKLPGPDDAAATRLAQHGFGDRRCFETLIGEWDGTCVGFALFFMTHSTFTARPTLYLEDLFEMPSHRRRGIGRALLQRLASIAVERQCGRFEWAVLDWNLEAQRFYASLGARTLPEWRLCRLDRGPSLARLAAVRAEAEHDDSSR